ncbi:MAG TPA: Spy/CpxP family protein refolding chaperone [Rhizomicrobium sp.]|nr:Spy/CpxP family protein refolding chaperone [Rhizomicrobium sp.]
MRKALMPLIASLALCGTATAALIATNARAAQTVHKPVMIALVTPSQRDDEAAPRPEGGPPPGPQEGMMENGARRAQFCHDMYAHKVGELAFLEAKLSLNTNQTSLFEHWKQASLDIAKQREGNCAGHERRARGPGQRPSVVDRLTMEEELLKRRLADIQAERPPLAALYAALTPVQKEEFGRGDMRRMAGRMHMMMGMMGRPHPGMEPERMGHGPMGEAPPPPPAQ